MTQFINNKLGDKFFHGSALWTDYANLKVQKLFGIRQELKKGFPLLENRRGKSSHYFFTVSVTEKKMKLHLITRYHLSGKSTKKMAFKKWPKLQMAATSQWEQRLGSVFTTHFVMSVCGGKKKKTISIFA